jgi:hypothetical protein
MLIVSEELEMSKGGHLSVRVACKRRFPRVRRPRAQLPDQALHFPVWASLHVQWCVGSPYCCERDVRDQELIRGANRSGGRVLSCPIRLSISSSSDTISMSLQLRSSRLPRRPRLKAVKIGRESNLARSNVTGSSVV